MADEAILNAARELQTRCERADRDVRHELGLMSASVATARATVRKIEATHASTQRHADEMARHLATDLRDAAAVMESSATSDRLAADSLAMVEHRRFSAVLPSTSPMRPFVVPPAQRPRDAGHEIKAYQLPVPSLSWAALASSLDLADELSRAEADIAAIAAATPVMPEKEHPASDAKRGTKETA